MGNLSKPTVGQLCGLIMSAVSVLGLLAFLVGALACRAGFYNRLVAVLVFDFWLLWPIGVLCCGVVILCPRFGNKA